LLSSDKFEFYYQLFIEVFFLIFWHVIIFITWLDYFWMNLFQQILQINGENVAGYTESKVNDIIKKAGVNNIVLAVRDRYRSHICFIELNFCLKMETNSFFRTFTCSYLLYWVFIPLSDSKHFSLMINVIECLSSLLLFITCKKYIEFKIVILKR
jgi:hypothetical protein